MRPAIFITFLALLCLSLPASFAFSRTSTSTRVPSSSWSDFISRDRPEDETGNAPRLNASAVATTVVLNSSKFDSGAACTANSWTSVDLTQQTGDWWHVDTFAQAPWGGTSTPAGITFNPIQDARSMWMAAVPPTGGPVNTVLCSYVTLPGYGNGWTQSFCSKVCQATSGGPTPNLDVAFRLKFDTEPSYDGTVLEYTTDCTGNTGWTEIDGGATSAGWSGPGATTVADSYAIGPGPVKVRLHFTSDTSWSDQDGLYDGFGVAVDSLTWEGTSVEGFETQPVGSHSSQDWQSCNTPGFHDYFALFKKSGANYEDQCLSNYGCYWAAINGSTEFYSCGDPSQPGQAVVPHANARGEVIANEIWSPNIAFSGTGSEFRLRYTVYRDLPLDNLVFHTWRVRTVDAGGCPGPWNENGELLYGDSKDWAIVEHSIGPMVDFNNGTALQVALGAVDMCPLWCGVYGSGLCHSPAPYFDSIKVLRVSTVGPQWNVRPVDTFQDTFATNGTLTGTARADEALDIRPATSPTIDPGDSAVVFYLVDPKYASGVGTLSSGLLADPIVSTFVGRHKTKRQVYMYVSVRPYNQPAKIGAPLSEGPGGQANRYPFMGTQVIDGVTWTKIRMDYTYGPPLSPEEPPGGGSYVPNRFNVDLNDNLFTPGDTVSYFYSASSSDATNYFSTEFGTTTDVNAIAANPMEFTILPAGGYNRGGDVLYVDGADGMGNESYWNGGMESWVFHIKSKVDRYDVKAPSSRAGNTPGGRVVNIAAQVSAAYKYILWDSGSLSDGLGDGASQKPDDYSLFNTFLGNLTSSGGIYLSGDDMAEAVNQATGAGAATFRATYMPFTLINGNHRLPPSSFRISPAIVHWPGRAYSSGSNNEFFVFGGCPMLNDFDVIGASGASRVEMSYNAALSPDGAVVSKQGINGLGAVATVIISGFSYAQIRDDELDGIFDRSLFLRDTLAYLGALFIGVGAPPLSSVSSLSQNYPNPFNPQTSIAFSLKQRGPVTLKIYDVAGALVRELVNDTRAAGVYDVKWDGRDESGQQVASGVYFYRLVAGDFRSTKKMVLLK